MTGMEPIADAVTGGLVGRAVEPGAGEVAADGHTHETRCLNCGTDLVGDYCHACGQRGHVHRSLSAFGHDLLHGVFHFEGKIWRTLPMLVWRPGDLTRRYIEVERASFVSPIALFLFSVFLMFAVLSATGSVVTPTAASIEQGMENSAEAQQRLIDRLIAQRTEVVSRGGSTAALDRRLAAAGEELGVVRAMSERGIIAGSAVRLSDDVPEFLRGPFEKAGKNPELLLFKLKTNAYKFSWMLIPLSVPFLWLLFPFSRRFRMYDHTVFVTYSLCFMTLLALVGSLLMAAGWGSLASFLWFVPPIHMYRQLRDAYSLSRGSALWRTLLLLVFTMTALTAFLLILVGLGIFD
ncbi:DUF3667 domain-containing protein [Sphingomonas sp. GCM10030256]|uniref:DUF3667 domain-containing protein n=1 Tax=Sphingomonas sp. GCM10030256 TaxID=3273427 RepID=UPI00361F6FC8